MAVDPACVGAASGPRTYSWSDHDTMLYALGIGAGVDDLALVTENSHDLPQQVLPTFAVIACGGSRVLSKAGEFDYGRLVHGAQGIRLHRPLPPSGALDVTSEIADVQDKGEGKNAVIVVNARGTDPATGELVAETSSTLVIRGAGGFGGRPGSSGPRVEIPERRADADVTYITRPDQALLYRLSGDRNPLHSDPWFATNRAGFPRTILHGLCTYGFAGRALLGSLCGSDPARFTAMSCRFVSPVFPGEPLTTSIWRTGKNRAIFITAVGEGDANRRVVLGDGHAEFVPSLFTGTASLTVAVSDRHLIVRWWPGSQLWSWLSGPDNARKAAHPWRPSRSQVRQTTAQGIPQVPKPGEAISIRPPADGRRHCGWSSLWTMIIPGDQVRLGAVMRARSAPSAARVSNRQRLICGGR